MCGTAASPSDAALSTTCWRMLFPWARSGIRSVAYPGQHEAIIKRATWQRVQEMLSQKATNPRGRTTRKSTGLLMGRLFNEKRPAALFLLGEEGAAALPILGFEETGRGKLKAR